MFLLRGVSERGTGIYGGRMTTAQSIRAQSTPDPLATGQTDGERAPALRTENLTKRYGSRLAVDSLDLEVPSGVVAGFIGPNGAGKTTTMAMLLGLVAPSAGSGTVLLGQASTGPRPISPRVGALIETPAFWPGLTGRENLRVLATLGGHDPSRISEVLALVGLHDRGGDRFGQYSLGMKQRLGIAAALLETRAARARRAHKRSRSGRHQRDAPVHPRAGRRRADRARLVAHPERARAHRRLADRHRRRHARVPGPGGWVPRPGPDRDRARAGARRRSRSARLDCPGEGHEPRIEEAQLVVPIDEHDARAAAAALNRAALSQGIVLAELHLRRPTLESQYLATIEGDR